MNHDWKLWGARLTTRGRFVTYVIIPVLILWAVLLLVLLTNLGVT